jgi:hypothetical protein
MIERRHGADAHEFLGANLYFGNANIIMEMWNDILGHALDGLLVIAPYGKIPYPAEAAVSTSVPIPKFAD